MRKNLFVLTAAFFAMATFAIAVVYALSGEGAGTTTYAVAGVALAISLALLGQQAKVDLDAVLTLLSGFLLGTALCVGIYLVSAHLPGLVPKATVVVAAVVGGALGFHTYRRQHGAGSADFPNVLAQSFDRKALLEANGVHFTALLERGGNGLPHRVSLYLQNCYDGPRQVTVRFDAEGANKYLRYHPEHRFELGPAEVCRFVYPVVAPTYPGEYPLFFSLAATGKTGKRVRLWRGREVDTRIKPGATGALLAVGILAWGGGMRFTIGPLPDDIWVRELPAPTKEPLWQPKPGTLPRG